MTYDGKYPVYFSSQVDGEIERVCTLNFENKYPYKEWKGYFDTCVHWMRALFHSVFVETDWTSGEEEGDIAKLSLFGEGTMLGSCYYKILLRGNRFIIHVIDIRFNKFQFQGYELLLEEPNYRVGYKPKFKIKGGKNAMKGKKVFKKLGSGYYLLKAGGHMTFLTQDKEEMLFPNKWFVAATDFYNGKAYVQCSDNNIYEIDLRGRMSLTDKTLEDIRDLQESRFAAKRPKKRIIKLGERNAIPLCEVMKMLEEGKTGKSGKKNGGRVVFNKLERELKAHEKETGIKVSRHPQGATQFSVKNSDGGEIIFYGDKDTFIAEVVKGLEKYGRLREMRTFEFGGKTYRQFRKCSDKSIIFAERKGRNGHYRWMETPLIPGLVFNYSAYVSIPLEGDIDNPS